VSQTVRETAKAVVDVRAKKLRNGSGDVPKRAGTKAELLGAAPWGLKQWCVQSQETKSLKQNA
jgi:hypothetical protein